MTLRTLVFKLLPLAYQLIEGRQWTTEQADEAKRLVLEITALSIVARNAGPGVETQQVCGIETPDGANNAVPGPEGASMPDDDAMTDDEARRMLR